MRRAALPLAIASLLISAPASAVMLNAHGTGQVLLYPYYTVNKGQDTMLSIVNIDPVNAKVAHLAVHEGMNGRPVADVDVFLAPNDTWTGVITELSENGGAVLRTADRSCTLPKIAGTTGLPLSASNYDGTNPAFPPDEGPHDITRTREGYIEVIASADIPPGTVTYDDINPRISASPPPPGSAVPANCDALSVTQVAADQSTPTATLFGAGSIVAVADGVFFGYAADALTDFTATPLFGSAAPRLDRANTSGTDGVRAIVDAGGAPHAIDFTYAIDAVSAVLMRSRMENEWLADPVGARPRALDSGTRKTDWVVTFPTKSWYVDKALYPANPTNPFVEPFEETSTGPQSTATLLSFVYDRAGGTAPVLWCSPEPTPNCIVPEPLADFSVSVFSFRDAPSTVAEAPSDVFGSKLVANTAPSASLPRWGTNGWASLDLSSPDGGHALDVGIDESSGNPVVLEGLPVIGFMAYDVVGAAAGITSAGGAFAHRSGSVDCFNCAGTSAARASSAFSR
jgi:hypothetical protein